MPRALVGWIEPIVQRADELMVVTDHVGLGRAPLPTADRLLHARTTSRFLCRWSSITSTNRSCSHASTAKRQRCWNASLTILAAARSACGLCGSRSRETAVAGCPPLTARQGNDPVLPGRPVSGRPVATQQVGEIGDNGRVQTIHPYQPRQGRPMSSNWAASLPRLRQWCYEPTEQDLELTARLELKSHLHDILARPAEPCRHRPRPARRAAPRGRHAGLAGAERRRPSDAVGRVQGARR